MKIELTADEYGEMAIMLHHRICELKKRLADHKTPRMRGFVKTTKEAIKACKNLEKQLKDDTVVI